MACRAGGFPGTGKPAALRAEIRPRAAAVPTGSWEEESTRLPAQCRDATADFLQHALDVARSSSVDRVSYVTQSRSASPQVPSRPS